MELIAERVAERNESAGVAGTDVSRGFDLEARDPAVESFDHEIDLLAVVGAPVADAGDVVVPGCLFEQLADDEGFEEMAEVDERRRIEFRQTRRGEPQQPGCEPGVDDVDLGCRRSACS